MTRPMAPVLPQTKLGEVRLTLERRMAYKQKIACPLGRSPQDHLSRLRIRQMLQEVHHRNKADAPAIGKAGSFAKPSCIGQDHVRTGGASLGYFCRIVVQPEAASRAESPFGTGSSRPLNSRGRGSRNWSNRPARERPEGVIQTRLPAAPVCLNST
jgi:hypothetical protein